MREVVSLLQRLIACDTSNPPGREVQAVAILEDYLESSGLVCERIAKDPERPNLLARLPGEGSGPSLAFLGHMDVVPARGEDWTVEPFSGIVRDGAIWGRGAVDMKCQVAASAVALATLARERFRPRGDLMLIVTADEEVGDAEVGAPFFVQQKPDLRLDYVVGEGAGERYLTPRGPIYLLDHGVKASVSVNVFVHGRPADASLPDNGRSAAFELARLLGRLESREAEARVPAALEPLLTFLAPDAPTTEERVARACAANPALAMVVRALVTNVLPPTVIDAPGPANAVLDRARVTLHCSVLPGTTKDAVEAELRGALGDGDYTLEIEEPEGGSISPLETPLHHAIQGFLAEVDPEARLIPALGYGFSDCHHMRTAYDAVTYGFIPFRHAEPMANIAGKHGVDERVLLDDLWFQMKTARHIAATIGGQRFGDMPEAQALSQPATSAASTAASAR
ncbi:MAG: M20/M25/M40 family metallo-hydrolase [Gaiellaceae bacterium]